MTTTCGKAKITSKGQITLPKAVRERLGLKLGDEIEFVDEKGRVVLRKPRPRTGPFDKWVGYLTHLKGQRTDDLIREMRGGDLL